ncbi:hypothetical protein [Marmoricola sp. RAF53]|uniref:hypothetical protein n=1 Tax=Marmoricola sp. RAF53 TaxID=3233059 RepID=UPI003F969BD2
MRRTITLSGAGVAGLALAASLAGCGGSDQAPVCDSVASLKSSVAQVKDLDPTAPGALDELQSGLGDVKTDLLAVKADAKSEFSAEVETIQGGYQTLLESVQALKTDPTTSDPSKVKSELTAFGSDIGKLITDIEETC